MIHRKNVINLGTISDGTILPSGQKCVYYLYYKSDKDLYLYDSEHDIETNLFNLVNPNLGIIEFVANKVSRSIIEFFSFNRSRTQIEIRANKQPIPTTNQSLTVFVKTNIDEKGTIEFVATKNVGTGNIEIVVKSNDGD